MIEIIIDIPLELPLLLPTQQKQWEGETAGPLCWPWPTSRGSGTVATGQRVAERASESVVVSENWKREMDWTTDSIDGDSGLYTSQGARVPEGTCLFGLTLSYNVTANDVINLLSN